MINHARTLLLNLPTGNGDIYIPPNYGVLPVPAYLTRFRNAALTGSSSPGVLLDAVASWVTLLHNADYEDFATALDGRITYEPYGRKTINNSNSFRIADAVHKVISIASQQAGAGTSGLFQPFAGYEQQLSDLKSLWDNKKRAEERAVAAVYGYIYQLERFRLNV
jgi:hypothetical protein